MKNRRKFLWFLFGLGSQFQLFGTSLCFTEIFVYGMAVLLFSYEYPYMRRNGVTTFFWISMALVVNAALSCVYNHTPFGAALRGMAVVCLMPCAIVVCHWMLRKDMVNFKWSIVGGALSAFLSTFFFQQAVAVSMNAGGIKDTQTARLIMSGPIWMIGQIGNLLTTFPKGWYLQSPVWLSACLPMGLAAFALFTSVSGRGASVRSVCSALIVFWGGKRPSQIRRRICGQFWILCMLGAVAIFGFKFFYQTAATSGWLGEAALKKYESQTKGNKSIGALIMGGRGESFIGLMAARDRPIIGWGPWARDYGGYREEFLAKFGTAEDVEMIAEENAKSGGGVPFLACHAHVTEFWCWYGIMGLIFWIYVMFVLVRYLRQDCYAVPQWFMWLAASVPAFFWDIFFNPFSARVGAVMFVVAVLMVRAVRMGRQQLPMEMIREIWKVERKG